MQNPRNCLYALILIQAVGVLLLINCAAGLQLPNASDLQMARDLFPTEKQTGYMIAVNRTRNVAESFSQAFWLIGADLFLTGVLAAMAISGLPRGVERQPRN